MNNNNIAGNTSKISDGDYDGKNLSIICCKVANLYHRDIVVSSGGNKQEQKQILLDLSLCSGGSIWC